MADAVGLVDHHIGLGRIDLSEDAAQRALRIVRQLDIVIVLHQHEGQRRHHESQESKIGGDALAPDKQSQDADGEEARADGGPEESALADGLIIWQKRKWQ